MRDKYSTVDRSKRHAGIGIGVLVALILLLQLGITASLAATDLKSTCKSLYKAYVTKDNGLGLYSMTSLGSSQKYEQALNEVSIVVDPTMSSVAKYDPGKKTIFLSRDPSGLSESEKQSLGQTIWHELTHRIEDSHGDIGYFDDADYAERNIEYMTFVADTALNYLRQMESKAAAGASGAELAAYWQKFLDNMEKAKKLSTNKPDIQTLKDWFGFDVDVDTIRREYASGRYGQALQQAVTPSTTQTGSGGAASGTYPGAPFNGMQITYSISGASVSDSKDSEGFTTSRTLSGTLGSGQLLVSGSAKMGNGYGADLTVNVSVDGKSDKFTAYIESGFPGFNEKSFSVAVPIPAGAKAGSVSISMTGHYNAGTRGLTVGGTFNAAAQSNGGTSGSGNQISVMVNGKKLDFDVLPIIQNGRTLVPIRKIAEALGCTVAWNTGDKSVTVDKSNTHILLHIDNKTAIVNGKSKQLDVPPRIIKSRTLLPLRFLAEEMGLNVSWDNNTKLVTITS